MEPELTKNGAKIEKSALNRPKWLPDGFQDHFPQKVAPTLDKFGVPSGTQQSKKTEFPPIKTNLNKIEFIRKWSQGDPKWSQN